MRMYLNFIRRRAIAENFRRYKKISYYKDELSNTEVNIDRILLDFQTEKEISIEKI
jgi:hypothetical protein